MSSDVSAVDILEQTTFEEPMTQQTSQALTPFILNQHYLTSILVQTI